MNRHHACKSSRKRTIRCVLTTGICCLLPSCNTPPFQLAGRNKSHSDGPHETTYLHDAGTVTAGQSLRHVFSFRNPLSVPIHLPEDKDVRTTCGCTRVQLANKRLLPNQATAVAMEVRTMAQQGAIVEQATVLCQTSHGSAYEVRFEISSHIRPALTFTPPQLTFSKQAVSQGETQTVWCKPFVPISDWQDVSITPDASYVEVLGVHQHPTDNKLGIDIRCRPTHQGGGRRAWVTLQNPQATNRWAAKLAVISEDTTKLQCVPPILSLCEVEDGIWTGVMILTGDVLAESVKIAAVSTGPQNVRYSSQRVSKQAVRLRLHVSIATQVQDTVPAPCLTVRLTNGQLIHVPWKKVRSENIDGSASNSPRRPVHDTNNNRKNVERDWKQPNATTST